MVIDPSNVTAVAFALAFVAGLVSFLSPCVLPLVPAYISYLGASSLSSQVDLAPGGAAVATRRNVIVNAVFFVLGFSLVFILLGATIGLVGFVFQDLITGLIRAGAALLIVFGVRVANIRMSLARWSLVALVAGVAMFFISVSQPAVRVLDALMVFLIVLAAAEMPTAFRLPLGVGAGALNMFASPVGQQMLSRQPIDPVRLMALLIETLLIILIVMFVSKSDVFYMEKRFEMDNTHSRRGVGAAMLMGAIFAAGWTPCVGPNLAAILVLGSEGGTAWLAAVLLAVYSLGLAIPFLAVALAFDRFARLLQRAKRYMGTITAVNGVLLVFMALLLLSGRLAALAQFGTFVDFGL